MHFFKTFLIICASKKRTKESTSIMECRKHNLKCKQKCCVALARKTKQKQQKMFVLLKFDKNQCLNTNQPITHFYTRGVLL